MQTQVFYYIKPRWIIFYVPAATRKKRGSEGNSLEEGVDKNAVDTKAYVSYWSYTSIGKVALEGLTHYCGGEFL